MATKLLDISFWQDTLDFSKIKNAGYDNIILRAGYGTTIDPKFNEYANACKKNKINIVGVYWFIYATNITEVKANANKCLDVIKAYKPKIVFADFEYDTIYKAAKKGVKLGAKECNDFTIEFCETVKKAGYIPGYYANMEFYNKMYSSKVKNKGYAFWLAHYKSDYSYHEPPVKCDFFQYTDRGTIPGLTGKIFDMDVCLSEKYLSKTSTASTTNKQEGGNKLTKEQAINALIAVAKNEIGYLEKATNAQLDSKTANAGYNNYTKYWRDIYPAYQGQPWCACQISWDMMTAFGLETAKKLLRHWPYVYCPAMRDYFTLYANPQVGDIVIFWSSKKKEFVHTGLVIKVQGDQFWTIEGNTSGASGVVANGGGICQKTYYNSQLPGTKFCRPDYSIVTSIKSGSSTNTSTTTTTKNWIEYGDRGNDVKNLQAKLNKVGHNLEVDGICGNATVSAIKDFQEKYNLTVDGQAGKNTITKLDSVIAAKENKNFKAFVGACTTNSTPVYQKATGATALATYPILNRGNLVDVIGMSGSRYKIKIANAYTGYIDKNKITTPDKLTTKYPHGVCTGNDVAVRKGAGKSYHKISGYPTLNKDNEVDILGSKKDSSGNVWKKVRIAGKHIGYVFGKYIKQD